MQHGSELDSQTSRIRLWPAWLILALLLVFLVLTFTPTISSEKRFYTMVLGPFLGGLGFFTWLIFFSHIPKRKGFMILGCTLGLAILFGLLSHATMGFALFIYGLPLAILMMTLALFFAKRRQGKLPIGLMVGGMALIFSFHMLGRLDGFDGNYYPQMSWRWATPVDQNLKATATNNLSAASWQAVEAAWPHFRGPASNGRATVTTPLNWQNKQPTELWRVPIGPGWSSFAHVSGRLFTQEQRGEEELISCYDAETGKPIWQTGHKTRFNEMVSGPGPRATPTYANSRIFAMGANGMVSALSASDGKLLWQHDLVAEVNAPVPMWGFSSSPLVINDLVIVYAGGDGNNGLMAFQADSGDVAWSFASTGMNYSSAQRATLGGQELVLFADYQGLHAFQPQDGTHLWQFKPSKWRSPPMVQVQQVGPEDLILPLGDESGMARLKVTFEDGTWQVEERWMSRFLKPAFNDFVFHNNQLYGFDQHIFACIDAETGKRQWKRGRYGFGQVVLLEPAAQLFVLGEQGQGVVLKAAPEKHEEMAASQVLEGKTWNHPIVADGKLFVRNGTEAACYALD